MLHNGREIAPSVSWDILLHVKRSGGMSVNELAGALKMSYMGVKQHCDDLKKRGYVDTWRRPKQTGRPEKIYRPTDKLDLVLPNWGGELCMGLLALVSQAYGETVPERLLYSFLQQKVEHWNARLKGTGHKERAQELVKLRGSDGWICQCLDDAHGLRIVDHHSPLSEVARMFPAVLDLEVRVLSRIFGHTLQRRMNGSHVEFVIVEGIPLEEPAPVSTGAGASKKGSKSKKGAAAATPASEPPSAAAAAPQAEATPAPEEVPATPEEEPVTMEHAAEETPAASAVEELSDGVFVTDVPIFEEEVVNKQEQAETIISASEPALTIDSTPPPLGSVLAPVEKPKRITKSVKQAVKAGTQQDLFDF
jgi:predicted ArsR family transcriptional regulator